MGTNFTTNISDAFLLTVSIYYPSGRRPWWPGEYIDKSRTRRAPLPKFYIQSLYTTLLLAPVVGRRSSEHSFWGGGSTKGASRGVHLPGRLGVKSVVCGQRSAGSVIFDRKGAIAHGECPWENILYFD